MSPLGRSRGQQPLCLKFLFTIGFENAAINKQVRRKENATKDKGKCNQGQTREDVEEYESFRSSAHEIRVENDEVRSESMCFRRKRVSGEKRAVEQQNSNKLR